MANRNFASKGLLYSMHVMPALVDCNFIVDSTNGNGLGQRSLKGPQVAQVFMNTSATPAPGNPNPEAGVIVVQLQDTWFKYYGGFSGFVSPIGTPSTSTVANDPFTITSLGTATLAQWQAVGLPVGFVPAVGQTFIATATATIGGAATAAPPAASGSGIDHIEVIGDPNTTINTPQATSQITLQCFKNGVLTAPAAGTVIGLAFYLSNSSITIQGE